MSHNGYFAGGMDTAAPQPGSVRYVPQKDDYDLAREYVDALKAEVKEAKYDTQQKLRSIENELGMRWLFGHISYTKLTKDEQVYLVQRVVDWVMAKREEQTRENASEITELRGRVTRMELWLYRPWYVRFFTFFKRYNPNKI